MCYFIQNLKWRKDNNIDNILLEDFSDLDADLRGFMEGCDKEGHPSKQAIKIIASTTSPREVLNI